MLTRNALLGFVVGIVQVNDADLIDQDRLLGPDVCVPEDRPAIRRMRNIIASLVKRYDYTATRRFEAETEGKSSAYVAMWRKRCREPIRRAELQAEFEQALTQIDDERIMDLMPPGGETAIQQLRSLISSVQNQNGTNEGVTRTRDT